jgi:hypothetical protein
MCPSAENTPRTAGRKAVDSGAPDRVDAWCRDSLRKSIAALGQGFLAANPGLRRALADGQLTAEGYWDELVRLSLQLLVVAIAEDRDLLVKVTASPERRQWYARHCTLAALCEPAPTSEHRDSIGLWRVRAMLLDELAQRHGALFARTTGHGSGGVLRDCALRNADLRTAIALLLDLPDLAGWGAQELGATREALLEFTPRIDSGEFTVRKLSAERRQDGGVYYTPALVAQQISRLALDLAVDRLTRADEPGEVLRIQAVDPACGAGVFLVAAARRLATRYAALLAGTSEPPEAAVRFALPIVMQECVYGVDIDPVAVDLAKAALWLEVAATRSHPMSFMDRNVICTNPLDGPEACPRRSNQRFATAG